MKILRFLLFPFTVLYYCITTIRNFLYDKGVLKSHRFDFPVIVVGNLSVGGTGKTPQIEYLVNLLKNRFKTAILSRGYKRKTKGFLLINNTHNTADVGDEPMQYFRKFKDVIVAVDENRVEGVQALLQLKSPEVVLLDDAYQHRKINGSFYILLTKYQDLFVDDFVLPTGNLRESRAGAKRADCIIVTKCPEDISQLEREKIQQRLKKYCKTIFFTTIEYSDKIYGTTPISLDELKNYQVLLITGIANPKPLLSFLNTKQIDFKHLKFADHHDFSAQDIQQIEGKFKILSSDNKIILTTEKDATRLSSHIKDIYYLPIETSFLEDKSDKRFDDLILNHINSFN